MKKKGIIIFLLLILGVTNSGYAFFDGDFTNLIENFGRTDFRDVSVLNLPAEELKLLSQEDYNIIGFANLGGNLETKDNNTTDMISHYVQPGDSLYLIAVEYGLTVDELIKANNLKSNIIFIGQKLLIPVTDNDSDKSDDLLYTVQPGDTLFLIALEYNTDVQTIKQENDLQTDAIYIGQKLFIPLPDFDDESPVKDGKIMYYVQPGDSLYRIAEGFDVTVGEIRELNGLSSNYLYVGQFLYIPHTSDRENQIIYYVQPGDSLYLIASKLNTTASNIRIQNGLRSDMLYIGQKLYIEIPDISDEDYNIVLSYHVKAGDTLISVGREFDLNTLEIRSYNDLKSNVLHAGQILKIPFAISGEFLTNSYSVTTGEMELLARAVYSEARGEPFKGQVAVAAVILNRVRHPFFPDNINDVIFQPWQFSAVHDGQFWLTPDETSYMAAQAALEGWDPSKGAIYYYNPDTAESRWVYYRNVVIEIGNHYFAV